MFDIRCPYCEGVHTAFKGEGTIQGWAIWDVHCPDTTYNYGVTEYTDLRVNGQLPLPELPSARR